MQVDYELLKMAAYCNAFEVRAAESYNDGYVNPPVYLSIGTEHIAATLYRYAEPFKLFAQHRCHSYFLCSNMDHESHKSLIRELCGLPTGCNNGMGGSASISNENMFGHSGLLGDQVPIAIGYAHASRKPTVCVLGDAAAEEDYVLGALGFAATHNVPILFICEDNNLSILTETKVRRSWKIANVTAAMKIRTMSVTGDQFISGSLIRKFFNSPFPTFINVSCRRGCWHAGVGPDVMYNDILVNYLHELTDKDYDYIINSVDDMWTSVERECDEIKRCNKRDN